MHGAFAQTQERERTTLDTVIPQSALEDLPPGSNIFSLFETVEPDVIADRMDTGGIRTGVPARVGAHGSSWTQTTFHVGDIDITDPDGSGEPMLLPGSIEWNDVRLTTGLMPITRNAPGLAITLAPRAPANSWLRTFDASFTPPGFVVTREAEAPAIETRVIHVVTRPGLGDADLRIPENTIFFGGGGVKELRMKPYYPPSFTHTADPCRVVSGVVRDKATDKPIAGAVVRDNEPGRYPTYYNRTTTDKEGRYRLTGLPLITDGRVVFTPGASSVVVRRASVIDPSLASTGHEPARAR